MSGGGLGFVSRSPPQLPARPGNVGAAPLAELDADVSAPKLGREALSAALKPGHFALKLDSAYVWDGKYSEGYRNDAFLVETPDGQCVLLRRPEQLEWRKNIPHPVQVAVGKPYILPGSTYGSPLKSLKALGLDTTKPGTYRITGLYMQSSDAGRSMRQLETIPFWGGNLATDTIAVTVK